MAVNKERVRLLVEALRSGKYQQGHGRLYRDSSSMTPTGRPKEAGHCCLGVGVMVYLAHVEDGLEQIKEELLGPLGEGPDDCWHTEAVLPVVVKDWYGFPWENPTVYHGTDGEAFQATQANDVARMTFAEIADGFEKLYLSDEAPDSD